MAMGSTAFGGQAFPSARVASAVDTGATSEPIADHTVHQSVTTVRGCTRRIDAFADHAGAGLL